MSQRSAIFHAAGRLHRADTCEPLGTAAAAGELRLAALVRGTYPGRPLPAGVLPQVCSIGFWDAAHDQAWGLGEHRNEGIEITYLDNGRLGFVVDGISHPLVPGHLTITIAPFFTDNCRFYAGWFTAQRINGQFIKLA